MTERLTEDYFDDMQKITRHYAKSNNIDLNTGGNDFQDIIDKLAEYETAEEEGRLVVLPKCNIGDTVYIPIDFQNKIYTGTIEGFEYAKMCNKWVVKIRTDDEGICYEAFDDFGKTFFLDVENAEKMLKEMEKDE